MLDLIALHHTVLGYDLFQQHSKPWNFPLSIAQRVKKSALGVLGANLKCRIEGAARGNHAQPFVEHKKRLADSVDDALSQCTRICEVGELFPELGSLHKASMSRSEKDSVGAQRLDLEWRDSPKIVQGSKRRTYTENESDKIYLISDACGNRSINAFDRIC